MTLNQTFHIDVANPSDGRALNDYLRLTYALEQHLITRSDEVRLGPLGQRKWIKNKRENPLTTCLLAKDIKTGAIIGMLDNWADARARVRHVTGFALTVANTHQGRGIGTALLNHFINWVIEHPILEKIELHVHDDNLVARKLYERIGFTHEGVRKGAVRYEDGRIVDDLIMGYWPKQKQATSSIEAVS